MNLDISLKAPQMQRIYVSNVRAHILPLDSRCDLIIGLPSLCTGFRELFYQILIDTAPYYERQLADELIQSTKSLLSVEHTLIDMLRRTPASLIDSDYHSDNVLFLLTYFN